MDEIHKMKQNGADSVNVEKVVAEDTRSLETNVKENGYWRYNLEQTIFLQRRPQCHFARCRSYKTINGRKNKKQLANKYFDENNMAKFILRPEK